LVKIVGTPQRKINVNTCITLGVFLSVDPNVVGATFDGRSSACMEVGFTLETSLFWLTSWYLEELEDHYQISLMMVFNRNRTQVFSSKCGPSAMSTSPRSSIRFYSLYLHKQYWSIIFLFEIIDIAPTPYKESHHIGTY